MKWIRKYTNLFLVVSGLLLTSGLFYLWQILGAAALAIPVVMAILIQLKVYVNQIKDKSYHLAADKKLLKAQDVFLQQLQDHARRTEEQFSLTSQQISELHEIEVEQKNMDQRLVQQIAGVQEAVEKIRGKQASDIKALKHIFSVDVDKRANKYRQIEAYLQQLRNHFQRTEEQFSIISKQILQLHDIEM